MENYDNNYDSKDYPGSPWSGIYDSHDSYYDRVINKKRKYVSSLGWSSGLNKYTDYYSRSSFRYYVDSESLKSAEVTLTKAFRAVRDMIVILNFPYCVNIQFLTNENENELGNKVFKPGTRRVFINTKVMDDDSKSEVDKINIMCGIGVHESAHLLFTEYSIIKSFLDKIKIDPLLHELANGKAYLLGILADIVNLLEDNRVEDKLLTERPGFLGFIENSRDWYLSNFKKSNISRFEKSDKFIKNFYSFLRFPESVDMSVMEEHFEFFKKIEEIISSDDLLNTKSVCMLSKKIFKELVKDKEAFLTGYKDSSSNNFPYQEILYGIDRDGKGDPNSSCISSILSDSEILQKLVYGKAERGSNKDSIFENMVGRRDVYMNIFNRIRKYIPTVRNIIRNTDKNYDFNIHGCRSGLLDTTKLAEAYQGVPQVYLRKGEIRTNKTTVCVLVDESGSMWSRNKDKLARDAAVLLNEAIGSLPGVDLYIYGHTADENYSGEVGIKVYRERGYSNKYSLSEIHARDQNRDGDAILEVAKRVRKFTNEKCIMFVISDGEPCAGDYSGLSAVKDTKDKVLLVENMGFDVIQISIDEVVNTKKMFTKYIDIKDSLSELPKKLSSIVKKYILNDKNSVIL